METVILKIQEFLKSSSSDLSKHIDMLLILGEEKSHYIRGSITLIKYKERYWGIATKHQIKDVEDTSKIAVGLMHLHNGAATSSEARVIKHPRFIDGSISDIVAFDFSEAVALKYLNGSRFFEVDLCIQKEAACGGEFLGFLAMGFSSADIDLRLCEDDYVSWTGLESGLRSIYCKFLHDSPNDPDVSSYQAVNSNNFDPDGMSGGMLAGFFRSRGSIHRIFGGVIFMAGKGNYHVITAQSILFALDNWDASIP